MITKEQYQIALDTIIAYKKQLSEDLSKSQLEYKKARILPNSLISDSLISVRLYNILNQYGLDRFNATVFDVAEIGLSRFKKINGVGSKIVDEYKELIIDAGLEIKL